MPSTEHDPGSGAVATTRVFLLDDHEVVRRGVRELLESDGTDIEVVGEAGTAEEALSRIPPVHPDVAVLDVRLPDGNGVEVCREIRSRHPEIQCLMLTSFADDEALFDAIMAGAAGYVLKQVRGNDLVDSVQRVARGQSLLDPSMTARGARAAPRRGPDDETGGVHLTEQERRILELLAEGLTNRQIGERLYLAEKTVKNYVSNLLIEAGHEPADRGRGVRRSPGRPARPPPLRSAAITRTPRHRPRRRGSAGDRRARPASTLAGGGHSSRRLTVGWARSATIWTTPLERRRLTALPAIT